MPSEGALAQSLPQYEIVPSRSQQHGRLAFKIDRTNGELFRCLVSDSDNNLQGSCTEVVGFPNMNQHTAVAAANPIFGEVGAKEEIWLIDTNNGEVTVCTTPVNWLCLKL